MTIFTADDIIGANVVAPTNADSLWNKTKLITNTVVDGVANFYALVKGKVSRFFDRHSMIRDLAAGTALWAYFTLVFVAFTVVATYLLIFAFTWADGILGL